MKQKLFGRLAAAAAVLLLSAATASAHDFEVNGIFYKKNSNGTSVSVTYKGSSYSSYSNEYSGAVTIPASVTYSGKTYSVTSIGSYAFSYCSSLESVVNPNSVTIIYDDAFRIGKSNLEMRPMFHFTEKRIEAHICICFIALKVYKELERRIHGIGLGISVDKLLDIAKTITTLKIRLPNGGIFSKTLFTTPQQHIVKLLLEELNKDKLD